MTKAQKRQKAITVFLLAKSLINESEENLSGKPLERIKSIERKLHTTISQHRVQFQKMVDYSSLLLSEVSLYVDAKEHSPLLVGLYVVFDNYDFLATVGGFKIDFEDIDTLASDIVEQSDLTKDQRDESNKIALEFQKYLFGGKHV